MRKILGEKRVSFKLVFSSKFNPRDNEFELL